jgi:uridine kinase
VLETAQPTSGRPSIVAVDGRSAGGKTSLAQRLAGAVPRAHVVHTDDVAWWHSMFDWAEEMRAGVLQPLHRGKAVRYRPPGWEARGRAGAIVVPADARLVIVEGVGAGRRELSDLVDAVIWVQTDLEISEQRDAVRVESGESSSELVERWMREELPFLEDQRPWRRSFITVAGAPELAHDPTTDVVVAPPLLA